MALDSYANLQTAIADWLNRSDLTPAIPTFIMLAEAQISRRLVMAGPVRRMMARTAITAATEFVDVPDDFMGVRTIYLTECGTTQLQYCTPDQINQKKAATDCLTGNPRFFAVVGGQYQFFPAPEASVSGEQTYWQRIPALSASNPTNWLLAINPDAYLYGALLQAAPYLKDDDRTTVWGTILQTALSDIVAADKIERDSTFQAIPYVPGGTP